VVALEQEKPRDQLFAELAALQRDVEKNLEVQEQFIRCFQFLVQTEEEPLSVINHFPCPVALFKEEGVLLRVNRVLIENTNLKESDISERNISFLDRITNDNFTMLGAAEGVFYGQTVYLSRLPELLKLFCKGWYYPTRDDYHKALFFPLPDGEGDIRHGAVMLLK